jgi:hypothetical protein
VGFGLGLSFFGFIFYPVLGFGDAEYQGALEPHHLRTVTVADFGPGFRFGPRHTVSLGSVETRLRPLARRRTGTTTPIDHRRESGQDSEQTRPGTPSAVVPRCRDTDRTHRCRRRPSIPPVAST